MNESDQFDRALEKLLADRSPRTEIAGLDEEEVRMMRMAQLLRGSRSQDPRPDFMQDLHERITRRPLRVTRRTAFLSSFGALAAGILAGVGLDHFKGPSSPSGQPLVDANRGKWVPVARVADLQSGAVRPFTAGAVQGFLLNKGGEVRAISRICTHMGCSLKFEQQDQAFVCPCHGAEFGLNGTQRYGPKRYRQTLPPLPGIDVRVRGESIEVFTA